MPGTFAPTAGGGGGAIKVLDNGAISAHEPDGTAAGGAERGQYAVDLQVDRRYLGDVASGSQATIGGGSGNAAGGTNAAVGGGVNNSAAGYLGTIAGGSNNSSLSQRSTIGGGVSNGAYATQGTVGGGFQNRVTGDNGTVPGGAQASAYLYGQVAHASYQFGDRGDAQHSTVISRNETTTGAAAELFLDGSSLRLALPAEKVWAFEGHVAAKQVAGAAGTIGDVAAWRFSGVIKRIGNIIALLPDSVIDQLGADAGAIAWTFALAADDANYALQLLVTGEIDKTIRWIATLDLAEVA